MAGVQAAGAIQGGKAAKQQANLQARVQQQQADRERAIANLEADRQQERNNAVLAQQRALLAGNGVAVNTGTSLMLQSQSTRNARFDEALVRAGGETRANRLESQAALTRFEGRQAARAGSFRAGTTLLRGGLTVGQKNGLFE